MEAKRIFGAITLTVLFGLPAAGSPPDKKAVPAPEGATGNRIAETERGRKERFLRLTLPVSTGDPGPGPRGPRNDLPTMGCDPSRSHCPIG